MFVPIVPEDNYLQAKRELFYSPLLMNSKRSR
jgi:hypothetical protein